MAMLADATATCDRLQKLRGIAEGADEAKAIESLRVELAEFATLVNGLAFSGALFREHGVSLSAVSDLASTQESVQKARERFLLAPKATTLRQGTRWTSLTAKLKTLVDKTKIAQNGDWLRHFDQHFFGGLPPAKRETTLAKTPENEIALKRYRDLYQSFIQFRLKPPTSAEDFQKLHLLSQQLAAIKFQEDVPEAVRKFLEALSTGAGLHLLTPDVLTWLQENGLLANYVVRARNS
jgi:hypothetical protein